ncbi:MAG: ribosome maturation factor RimP [Lachnospiraceae bacterium]|jgi:ribosome maturation factor RimP|nr:ribosome maturation factor RimP [Lachnospiraceae bacterium]SEI41533.1 ribosome maturation factor RimP [Lachnospiraceae bacterium A10]
MSLRETYVKRTEELVQPLLDERNFELWDVEYVKEGQDYFLRIFIDKPGGITIDDCVDISRAMNEILDREDYISDPYTFEVSSPGLGRQIKNDRQMEKSIGEDVEIRTYKAIDKQKQFEGVLVKFDKDTVTISIDEEERSFSRKDISTIRYALDF